MPSTSQRATTDPWQKTTLCREILSLLNRCFGHDVNVKRHLYHGKVPGVVVKFFNIFMYLISNDLYLCVRFRTL